MLSGFSSKTVRCKQKFTPPDTSVRQSNQVKAALRRSKTFFNLFFLRRLELFFSSLPENDFFVCFLLLDGFLDMDDPCWECFKVDKKKIN